MTVRPLYDKLIVIPDKVEDKTTASGLVILAEFQEKPQTGVVESAGNGWIDDNGTLRKMEVKAGDRIVFGKHAGIDVRVNGEERIMLKESEVIAILED